MYGELIMREKVYGNDGATYTIVVKQVGHAFGTQAEVITAGKKIWESQLYPYMAREAAFRAATSHVHELAGGYRYVGV
jgi:hypothetical protein